MLKGAGLRNPAQLPLRGAGRVGQSLSHMHFKS